MWQIGGHRSFLRGGGYTHAKDGQEGEAMRPDCKEKYMSRWDGGDEGRAEALEEEVLKAVHQVYCVQSAHGLPFG